MIPVLGRGLFGDSTYRVAHGPPNTFDDSEYELGNTFTVGVMLKCF